MECGIVGLPNVGKSTLFNALTATASAQAANYPFCTIEPNIGTVCVPDERLALLAEKAGSATVVPTQLTFVDIAGLVRGASQGEGLGNQFLSHIRQVDAILQVVRCFEDENVIHVAGEVNPLSDIDIIETELMLADLQSLENRLSRKKKDEFHSLLEKAHAALSQGRFASEAAWDEQEKLIVHRLDLLTLKPIVYICNISENHTDEALIAQVKAHAAPLKRPVIVVCNELESQMAVLSPPERSEFLTSLGIKETGLDQVIRAAYDILGLSTFFTAGPKEVRAWTVLKNASAFDAAGVIHTDFQKGFIRAEVISYQNYASCTSVAKLKEEGKVRLEGKEYRVQDGDVMLFRFNV
jgi:GTP-binding protein YchF